MFRKILFPTLILTLIIAACTSTTPTPMAEPTQAESMPEENITEEPMEKEMMHEADFLVRIEVVSEAFKYLSSGVFNTPVGHEGPGPLTPGSSYSFEFSAVPGSKLSFATMFVQSNDLFYAPSEAGIQLFNENSEPISGDVTGEVKLWDAGTEVNQDPGIGIDQAPRQAGPDTGEEEGGVVRGVDDGFSYPIISDHIRVSLEPIAETRFNLSIENISDDESLLLAPGAWVVHTADAPLFSEGETDRGEGVEALAEDGDPSGLAEALGRRSGITSLIAPGVWVIHKEGEPLFSLDEEDRALGLEALAEDGNPGEMDAALANVMGVVSHGVFNTPSGADQPGPVGPGGSYEFSFRADEGSRLSFATMFVQSNDLFYAPDASGIALFSEEGEPISGEITSFVYLWDAGTEVNQEPGIGLDQAPRQAGPNSGEIEKGVVQLVSDGYSYPENVIRVTILPQQ